MRFAKTIASASVAAVLGLAGVSVAGAASTGGTSPTSSSSPAAVGPGAGGTNGAHARAKAHRVRARLVRRAGAVAAKAIGIDPKDLATEVRGGKTIAQVATEHGVQPQTVIDAIEAAAKARIEKAKAAGRITADRAAKLEQRVDTVVPKFVNDWHPKVKPAS